MEDLFNFDKKTVTKTNEKLDAKAMRKEKLKQIRTVSRDDNFANVINSVGGFPKENEMIAIKTNGTSDCGSIFSYAINTNEVIDEMYLATWTISKENIKRLRNAIESGKLLKLIMVFSSTLKAANPALYANLMSNLKEFSNVQLKEINSHAKTFSIKIKDDYITVSGSANWSENPRIENFLIVNSEVLYNHHSDWMGELAEIK